MNYKDFQTYIDLINYIRDLTLENRDKKDLLSLVKELCDEVEETNYGSGYNAGYCAGYEEGGGVGRIVGASAIKKFL